MIGFTAYFLQLMI